MLSVVYSLTKNRNYDGNLSEKLKADKSCFAVDRGNTFKYLFKEATGALTSMQISFMKLNKGSAYTRRYWVLTPQ